jgi:hypothetical protein
MIIVCGINIIKDTIVQFSQCSYYSSLFGRNLVLSVLNSNTSNHEELISAQLVSKSLAFYGTQNSVPYIVRLRTTATGFSLVFFNSLEQL